MNVSVTTLGKRCNVPLVCIKYRVLVKAHGNSLSHWPYLWSRCGIYHQSIPTWFHDLSLLGVGGLASRTLKPLWFIGQKLTRNLKINDSVSCRERAEEKSHSLQCPMGGQGKTDREGERKSTGGYYRSCAGHLSRYYRVFRFVQVLISPQVWKENQYTIQRKCVNHWTDGGLLPRGRDSQ